MDMAAVECLSHDELVEIIQFDIKNASDVELNGNLNLKYDEITSSIWSNNRSNNNDHSEYYRLMDNNSSETMKTSTSSSFTLNTDDDSINKDDECVKTEKNESPRSYHQGYFRAEIEKIRKRHRISAKLLKQTNKNLDSTGHNCPSAIQKQNHFSDRCRNDRDNGKSTGEQLLFNNEPHMEEAYSYYNTKYNYYFPLNLNNKTSSKNCSDMHSSTSSSSSSSQENKLPSTIVENRYNGRNGMGTVKKKLFKNDVKSSMENFESRTESDEHIPNLSTKMLYNYYSNKFKMDDIWKNYDYYKRLAKQQDLNKGLKDIYKKDQKSCHQRLQLSGDESHSATVNNISDDNRNNYADQDIQITAL